MAGFLDRAREQAQRGLRQGREKVGELQSQWTGQQLVHRLGVAYYRQQQGTGSEQEVRQALAALERHVAQHGDGCLR
mgnify:CR=1 FL=1